jgi:hypothetical protein
MKYLLFWVLLLALLVSACSGDALEGDTSGQAITVYKSPG